MTVHDDRTEPRPSAGVPPFSPPTAVGQRIVIVASTLPARIVRAGDRATVLQSPRPSGVRAIKVAVDRTGEPVVLVPGAGDGWSVIGGDRP